VVGWGVSWVEELMELVEAKKWNLWKWNLMNVTNSHSGVSGN